MSAMVVAPAAAARQWTNKLGVMVVLAAIFGAIAGVGGALISSLGSGLSTGPVIVLAISVIVLISLLFAPSRGVLWSALSAPWRPPPPANRPGAGQSCPARFPTCRSQPPARSGCAARSGSNDRELANALNVLATQGLVTHVEGDLWSLTPAGVAAAEQIAACHCGPAV